MNQSNRNLDLAKQYAADTLVYMSNGNTPRPPIQPPPPVLPLSQEDYNAAEGLREISMGMRRTLPPRINPSHDTQKGGVKEYIVYNSHRYVVKKNDNKKCIVSKGKTIYLSTIKGQYKKV